MMVIIDLQVFQPMQGHKSKYTHTPCRRDLVLFILYMLCRHNTMGLYIYMGNLCIVWIICYIYLYKTAF